MPRPFLAAEWRKLVMAQYEVPPATLLPHLPPGLELDLYNGYCFVSLVGFLFDHVRVLGIPIPLHTRFPEVNLRFYVKRTTPQGELRRGVVFLSEIVPRHAISLVARTLYDEPYRTLPMRYEITSSSATPGAAATVTAAYHLRHFRRWQTIAVTAAATPHPIAPGSPEEFITEHYFGYTRRSRRASRQNSATSEYGVLHPRWNIYAVQSHTLTLDTAALYGPAFADLATRAPDNILLAEGSPISVLHGRRFPA